MEVKLFEFGVNPVATFVNIEIIYMSSQFQVFPASTSNRQNNIHLNPALTESATLL